MEWRGILQILDAGSAHRSLHRRHLAIRQDVEAIGREMVLVPRGVALQLVHVLSCQVAGQKPRVTPAAVLPQLLPSIPEDLLPGVGGFTE